MTTSNPFGYNNWFTRHDYHANSAGDEFLVGDEHDLTAGNDGQDQGNATIITGEADYEFEFLAIRRQK